MEKDEALKIVAEVAAKNSVNIPLGKPAEKIPDEVKAFLDADKKAAEQKEVVEEKKVVEEVKEEVKAEVKEPEKKAAEKKVIDTPLFRFEVDGEAIKKDEEQKVVATNEVEELKNQLRLIENYKEVFDMLPIEVKKIVADVIENRDYNQTIKNIATSRTIDFKKDADAYKEFDLVNYYNPTSQDEWDEMNDTQRAKLYGASVKLYKSDKREFDESEVKVRSAVQERKSRAVSSINETISNFKRENPNIPQSTLKKIEDVLYDGAIKEIYKDDGTYRPDAAEKISYALYGKETTQKLVEFYQTEAQKRVSEAVSTERELIMRETTKDKIDATKEDGTKKDIGQMVKESMPYLKMVK